MENVTHTLAGVVAAELVIAARKGPIDPTWARAAWVVSAVAQNAPDVDVIAPWALMNRPVGYLLHHRGHTHVLLAAPLLSLAVMGIALAWARRRDVQWSRADVGWLALLAAFGPLGHLALDYGNDYGIHPFWPFWNGWVSGDSIFIFEPLLWAAAIPCALAATRSWGWRVTWGSLLALAVFAPWIAPFVPWPFALAGTCVALASIGTMRAGRGFRASWAVFSSVAIVFLFAVSSREARARVETALAVAAPDFVTLDVARAPIPATPACWNVVAVQREEDGDRYALRRLRVSAWAPFWPAEWCPELPSRGATAALVREDWHHEGVLATSDYEGSIAELRTLAARPDVAAYLRFARAPFVGEHDGQRVIGDLRYDREDGIGFAEMPLEPERDVGPSAPWRPWREDLLER